MSADPLSADPVGADPAAPGALLRVLRGAPSPEELAALTAVLTALAARAGQAGSPARDRTAGWQRVRPGDIRPGSWMSPS
ncbi:acyl-CoA carboxylase subunit epsilon [Streptomyces sp. NRRL WC-3742]|uniref:acyl-CoA carboxylase subunit epsilon n=1 Tax=Streptomyces sp. NRRL WC-3742 TaxID=1463934 RepID=UPI00131C63AF|nr:acyl-CoA carboxylase subunit epsilon [Streptomyces sp. NRRL WC-3742]